MKLFSKLKDKHVLSLAGNVIMSGLGMCTVALLYRYLTVREIGIWVFFQSTILLIDTFRSGFLTTAFIKFYAGTDEKRSKEVLGSTWLIALAITGCFIVFNVIALSFLHAVANEGLFLFLKWFALTYICNLPSFIASCVVQAEQRFDRLLYIRFSSQGLFITGIILLALTHHVKLEYVIYTYLSAALITSFFTLFAGYAGITTLKYRTNNCSKEIFNFGKYSVGTTLSSNLFGSSDTYIINFMLGPSALAVYNLGQRLMELVEIPLRSFAATAMPSLSTAYNQNDRQQVIYIMKKYAGMLTVALVPISLIAVLLADVAIGLIGGGKYIGTETGHQAANIFRLFMTFALLYPVDRFFALTLDVIHQPKINFIKVLIMLAANIIGDFAGIYIFGNIYGVAITTVIPTLIGTIIGFVALNRYIKFSFWDVYKLGYTELKIVAEKIYHRH